MFAGLNQDIEMLVDSVIELCYFMRGSIGYEEMFYRTPGERQRINKFISKRLEKESKRMNPVY